MGTPQSLGATADGMQILTNRLVWVLNRDIKYSYKANWRGIKVCIPPDKEKIAKRFEDGGNLFPYLEAVKFVRDLKEPQEWIDDGGGKPQPIFRTKELFEHELTKEEFDKIVGKTEATVKKEIVLAEKSAKRTFKKTMDNVKNKQLVTEEDSDE